MVLHFKLAKKVGIKEQWKKFTDEIKSVLGRTCLTCVTCHPADRYICPPISVTHPISSHSSDILLTFNYLPNELVKVSFTPSLN